MIVVVFVVVFVIVPTAAAIAVVVVVVFSRVDEDLILVFRFFLLISLSSSDLSSALNSCLFFTACSLHSIIRSSVFNLITVTVSIALKLKMMDTSFVKTKCYRDGFSMLLVHFLILT